ncbi:hypothetical protein BLNAU_19485 [Blattamonas nauphoetae]|uniref:Uncharacterized protein n=1 Tax=Blattamonas nauphoetae TaxID=2049346 RepID=A0ABQ9X2K1_9EUKA|nr:hypothetical protein BLNAU_19485 [Blattamonas nauphoetae]
MQGIYVTQSPETKEPNSRVEDRQDMRTQANSDGSEQMEGESEMKDSEEFDLDQFSPFSSGSNLVGDFRADDLRDNDACECDSHNDVFDFDQLIELDDEDDETRSCSAISVFF